MPSPPQLECRSRAIAPAGGGSVTQAIRWGEDLLQAVPQMDREHESLVAEVNQFLSRAGEGAARAELEVRLSRLLEAFKSHFDSEEGLMREAGFPGLESHAEEHRKLACDMAGLRDDLGS